MIASITGLVKAKKDNWVLVETGGLGYKVFVPDDVFNSLRIGEQTFLYTHHHIKEDSQSLYGFFSSDEKELFELLLSISGIGPKVAISVLNSATINELRAAVVGDNPEILTGIAGIGAKTAKRIVLELKNKIKISDVKSMGVESTNLGAHMDAHEALLKLGYNSVEARAALKMIPNSVKDSDEKVRMALKNLGK